jgi:hypothetical protein
MPEQRQRQRLPEPERKSAPFGGGPTAPNIEKPDTSGILKKLRKVESDQAKRYRQRSGQ